MQGLLVVGAGGFGRAVAETVAACGEFTVVGFVDDRWPDVPPVAGLPVLGRVADLPRLRSAADAVVVAIGNNRVRHDAFLRAADAGFAVPTVVHARAWVSPSVSLERGVIIMAGAMIGTEARLRDGVLVNAGAVVDHHGVLGAFAHVGVGACMGGGATLGAGAWLKAGQILPPGQHLPDDNAGAESGA